MTDIDSVTEDRERTYLLWAPLVALDSKEAAFRNEQTGVAFVIPTAIWINLNRPGHLSIPLRETFG